MLDNVNLFFPPKVPKILLFVSINIVYYSLSPRLSRADFVGSLGKLKFIEKKILSKEKNRKKDKSLRNKRVSMCQRMSIETLPPI